MSMPSNSPLFSITFFASSGCKKVAAKRFLTSFSLKVFVRKLDSNCFKFSIYPLWFANTVAAIFKRPETFLVCLKYTLFVKLVPRNAAFNVLLHTTLIGVKQAVTAFVPSCAFVNRIYCSTSSPIPRLKRSGIFAVTNIRSPLPKNPAVSMTDFDSLQTVSIKSNPSKF